MIESYHLLRKHLIQSLFTATHVFCKRCARDMHHRFSWEGELFRGKPHHEGLIQELIQNQQYDPGVVLDFIEDTEHGLFHGICVYLVATLHSPKFLDVPELRWKEVGLEQMIASCLLHDFARFAEGDKNHDKNLADHIPCLDLMAYDHSHPSDAGHWLVAADRWELCRYDGDWIKPEMLEGYFDEHERKLLNVFYSSVRPALEVMFRYRDEYWIRHGVDADWLRPPGRRGWVHFTPGSHPNIEKEAARKLFEGPCFPESQSHWQIDKRPGRYSIELSKGPFGSCIRHQTPKFLCTMYGIMPVDHYVGGFDCIVHEDQTGYGINGINRDHLLAKDRQPYDKWVFSTTDLGVWPSVVDKALSQGMVFVDTTLAEEFVRLADTIASRLYVLLQGRLAT